MASNISGTAPNPTNTDTKTSVSPSVSQNIPVTALSLSETPTHKTKDGLIRMLLQTATPSTLQQPKQVVTHGKQSVDTIQSSGELKIHGGILGHYNNGHITQPHPSAIHPIPKQAVQLASGTDARNPLSQMTNKHFTINQGGTGAFISNLPVTSTSHCSLPGSSTHNVKIDMQGSGPTITNAGGSHVVASVIRDKLASPNSTATGETCETIVEKVTLHDEAPYKFIHQISDQVNKQRRSVKLHAPSY